MRESVCEGTKDDNLKERGQKETHECRKINKKKREIQKG